MTDIKITGLAFTRELAKAREPLKTGTGSFDDVMREAIGKVSQVQQDAEAAVKALAGGGDITQAIISMERADMSFQLMVEVRNRLLSAYEEISRMQV